VKQIGSTKCVLPPTRVSRSRRPKMTCLAMEAKNPRLAPKFMAPGRGGGRPDHLKSYLS